ncbi:MAG: hypothetical protein ACYC6N_01240 [Pirellulaceae bacterium]
MDEQFFMSPHEATILGYCMGLYLSPDCDQVGNKSFAWLFDQWIVPHFPVFDSDIVRTEIARDAVPADTTWWSTEGNRFTIGYSTTTPDMVYYEENDVFTAERHGYQRNSFPQELAHYLKDVIPLDLRLPWLVSAVVPAALQAYSFVLPSITERLASQWTCTSESKDAVASKVDVLIQFNECQPYYQLGMDFGSVNSALSCLETTIRQLDHAEIMEGARSLKLCEYKGLMPEGEMLEDSDDVPMDDNDYAEWFTFLLEDKDPGPAIRPSIDRLSANSLVKRVHLAATTVDTLRTFIATVKPEQPLGVQWSQDVNEFALSTDVSASRATRLATHMNFAFSELLGILHEVSDIAKSLEWSKPQPSTFRDLFDATGDKVRLALQDAEKRLNESADQKHLAETVVCHLSPAVEAISRRTWPMDTSSPTKRNFKVAELLRTKLHRGADLERRFARIALALLDQYRNAVQHEFDTFECSLNEARYYTQAVRTLLDLSLRIQPRT